MNTPFYNPNPFKRSPADRGARPSLHTALQGSRVCIKANSCVARTDSANEKASRSHPSQSTPSASRSLLFSPRNLTGLLDVMDATHLQGTTDSTSGVAESDPDPNAGSQVALSGGEREEDAATVELSTAKAKSEYAAEYARLPEFVQHAEFGHAEFKSEEFA